jgi:hypothetical protein
MSANYYYKEITQKLNICELDELIKLLTLFYNKERTIDSQISQITYILRDNTLLNISNDEIFQRVLDKITDRNLQILEDKINDGDGADY